MQLNKINENVYYIDAAVNMGLVVNDSKGAVLVDTGIDDSVARKVRRLLQENGLELKGIIITHAHADHCGGAPYLVKSTGARVYASILEKSVLEFPLLEPLYLFSGAHPPAPLHNKFFLAPGVKVDEIIIPGTCNIEGCEVEVVDLSGHALGQVGISVQGVLFCADAVIAPDVIQKHGIPLNAHLAKALVAYDLLELREERYYVPAHSTPVDDIKPLTAANRSRINEAKDFILDFVNSPRTVEESLAGVCNAFDIKITNIGQYYLMHLTVMAYISYLLDKGDIVSLYEQNRQFLVVNKKRP